MYNLTYNIKENGYEILRDGIVWIEQYEPYIPNPNISYEENAKLQIEELNEEPQPNEDIESLKDRLNIQEEQNNLQEEMIASMSYELMMMQESVSVLNTEGTHSKRFNSIKLWYTKGYWTEDMVMDAVIKGYITEEESNKILGK